MCLKICVCVFPWNANCWFEASDFTTNIPVLAVSFIKDVKYKAFFFFST